MPSVKSSVAILAGAAVHLFLLPLVSHDLRRDIGVSAHSSNYSGAARILTTGWITNAGLQHSLAPLERNSRGTMSCDLPPDRTCNAISRKRQRSKPQRRRTGAILPLNVAGVEGVGVPPATSTTTNSAVSIPQPSGGTTAPPSTKQPPSAPASPPVPPPLPAGALQTQPAAGAATGVDRKSRTSKAANSSGTNGTVRKRSKNGPLEISTSPAAATTTVGETAVVDEGEAICRQLEDVGSREVDIGGEMVSLRMARLEEYLAIADVRFSVFSPVHSTLKHRFRERSCSLMAERRRRGAFCLVAILEKLVVHASLDESAEVGSDTRNGNSGDHGGSSTVEVEGDATDVRSDVFDQPREQHVFGTLECSKHEFDGTPLEQNSGSERGAIPRLYLTEVAVRSDCRRLGIGRHLLGLVDDVARCLSTSEIFLHVNEVNEAAVNLYTQCGYEDAPDSASNRAFTNSLGLSGGFIGQRHRLLRKSYPVDTARGSCDGAGEPPTQ